MLKYIILLFLPVCFSACKSNRIDDASGTIHALSYNVAGLPAGISSSLPERNMVLVSPLLNEFDIVHVQEDFCYHDSLLLHNTHRSTLTPLPCIGDGLGTFTNYDIIDYERVAWDDCTNADCLSLKGFTYANIEILKGVSIDFYNVHFNAGGSNESIEARKRNMTQFLDYMLVKSEGQATIVMGDFNSRYTRIGDTAQIMLDLGFSDPWIDLIRNGVVPENDNMSLMTCSPNNTASMCEGVDKVFYKGNEELSLEVAHYQYGDAINYFYQSDTSQALSDHPPLFVDFNYDYHRK